IIATNSDILFSEALVRYLKELAPDDNSFYRAPRHDFISDGTLPFDESEFRWSTKYVVGNNFCEAAGDFFACTPHVWGKIQGYSESPRHVRHLDSEAVIRAISLGLQPVIVPPVYHKEHPESTKFVNEWKPEWGAQDNELIHAAKIMPRNPVWGHRHCKLIMLHDCLALLQNNDWDSLTIENHYNPAELLNREGESKFASGDIEGAKKIFIEIINRWPKCYIAYNNLGVIYWDTGNIRNALQYFSKALEFNSCDRHTVLNCVNILASIGKFEDAKKLCLAYLQNNPSDEEISRMLQESGV
ncbi:MAG: hypothetical protein FD151_1811, partial [bacterium]